MSSIYQIKISLLLFEPTIWRRVLIFSDATLGDMHKLIQASMGWENCHMHRFIKDKISFLEETDDYFSSNQEVNYVSEKLSIQDLLPEVKSKLKYEYDFGDSWEHELVVENKLDIAPQVPVCLDGEMACPPEDCGGVWGYAHLLEVLKDSNHEEYEDVLDWMGQDFDAQKFDPEEANGRIKGFFSIKKK